MYVKYKISLDKALNHSQHSFCGSLADVSQDGTESGSGCLQSAKFTPCRSSCAYFAYFAYFEWVRPLVLICLTRLWKARTISDLAVTPSGAMG